MEITVTPQIVMLAHERAISHLSKMKSDDMPTPLEAYMFFSADTISEVRKQCQVKTSFVRTVNTVAKLDQQVFKQYLHIARMYVDMKVLFDKIPVLPNACVCSSMTYTKEEGAQVCTGCGKVTEKYDSGINYRDADRVSTGPKYNRARQVHFVDAMLEFEGAQNVVIPSELYTGFEHWKTLHGITTVRKDDVYDYLVESGYNEHYSDINLIHHNITGEPLPNLRQYKTRLLELYNKAMEAFDRIKNTNYQMGDAKNRKSSPIVNFILYMLLLLVDYPVKMSDFYMLKTDNKKKEHQRTWEKICEYDPSLRKVKR